MHSIRKLIGATALLLPLLTATPGALAATQTFEFKRDGGTVAFGSFSYSDGLPSVLSFAQLSDFEISINISATFQDGLPRVFKYSLADVLAMPTAPVPAGQHFGFDTTTNQFVSTVDAGVPALAYFGGDFAHATMAAYSSTPDNGFLIDWRAPGTASEATSGILAMASLPGGGATSGLVSWNSYTISAVSPVSEPSSMAMAFAGLAIVGFVALKRRRA